MRGARDAIALLITLLFVIVITVAIGYSLRQVNSAVHIVKDESSMYQNSILLEDIMAILENSPDVARVADSNSSEELFVLLSQASFIPLESSGVNLLLKIKSARGKFNPASFNPQRIEAFREYVNLKMVNNDYVDILLDCVRGIKADGSYNSNIFNEKPYLFRNYIASEQHLKEINDFFAREYNDNSLSRVDFDNLFSYGSDTNNSIDLNYATTEVWQLLLGASKERARELSNQMQIYTDLDSLGLTPDEQERLERFSFSFFEPVLLIEVEIEHAKSSAYIRFEYDLKTKKGSNFVYEI